MIKNLCIVTLAVSFFACQSDSNNEQPFQLGKISEQTISVDSATNYDYFYMQAVGDRYLAGLDIVFQSLNIFDLKEGKLAKKLEISSEGENGMLPIKGFHFHNWDSIFLFHRYPTTIYLVDSSGTIKNKWFVDAPLPGNLKNDYLLEVGALCPQNFFNAKTKTFDMVLYHNLGSLIEIYSLPIFGQFSLDSGKVTNVYANRSESFLQLLLDNKSYGPLRTNPKFFVQDSLTYVASQYEHVIKVYNNKTNKEIKQVEAKSRFLDKFPTVEFVGLSIDEMKKSEVESPGYDNFVYDPHRKLYYRAAKHKNSYKDALGRINLYEESPWSLMVFDQELKFLGELAFEAGKYDFRHIFPTQDGLLLKNVMEQEGEMKFSLFNVPQLL
jgi:hypothetical protein